MIQQQSETSRLVCVCPECKNVLDLSRYPNLAVGMIIECNHCGMTLLVKEITADNEVKTVIVDEGK